MQLEIRNAVERDRVIYNAVGFAAGCLIAILFFRRGSFMAIAAGPPLIATLLGLGALGWFDFHLNLVLNLMTPLIMVISFSDSMQLTFAARDRLIGGESRYEAFRNSRLVVGPACVLPHGTAGLSFIALQFSQSDLIRSFGEAGLIATLIALVTVLTLVPLFGILLIRHEARFAADARPTDRAIEGLRDACGWIAGRMVRRPLDCLKFMVAASANLSTRLQACEWKSLMPHEIDPVPTDGRGHKAGSELDRLSTIIRGFNDRWPERPVPAGLGLDGGPLSQERLLSDNIDQALSQAAPYVSMTSKIVASASLAACRSGSESREQSYPQIPRDRCPRVGGFGSRRKPVPRPALWSNEDHCLPNVPDIHGALAMTRITLAVALLTFALPTMAVAQGSHSSGPPAAPAAETENFVRTAADANTFEIQSSQIALQKATNEQVKDFAHLMIKDHTRIGDEFESIAQKQNLQLPKGLDSKSQSSLKRLQSESGTRFSRTYARMMLKGHQQAANLFESYAQNGDDQQLKEWAQRTLPTLQEHLRRAEAMERNRPVRTSAR